MSEITLKLNLKEFNYRREQVGVREIFPEYDASQLHRMYPAVDLSNPHQVVLDTALELWDGGYERIIDRFSFHDQYKKFTKGKGHCHQMTPMLGIVLKAKGFERVAYLECYRFDPVSNKMIPPEQETNLAVREEFCGLGRIPYCCLEVEIGGKLFYLSPKHIKRGDQDQPMALLKSVCYREMIGVFAHQDDPAKSGIYLDVLNKEPMVWRKQGVLDSSPEFFRTFAHMELVI